MRGTLLAFTLLAVLALVALHAAAQSAGTVAVERPSASDSARDSASDQARSTSSPTSDPSVDPTQASKPTASARVLLAAIPARAVHASVTPARATTVRPAAPQSQNGYGCAAALSYLRAHAAPGFTLECPGYAWGAQAMTCVRHAPQCAGTMVIAIAVPCPAAYMNEAHNSWILADHVAGTIDPYGYCH